MLVSIIALPLVGFLLNASLGRRLSKRLSGGVGCATILGSFVLSAMAVWRLVALAPEDRTVEAVAYTWIAAGDFVVPITLRLDPLAAVMILVVTGVGFLIHVYSTGYMHEERDAEYARYFSYLNLFVFFMLLLVLGGSLPILFVGWEGVGLCSYLLIGFWYRKRPAADAGKKAFVVNRVGDFAFLLGMIAAFVHFGTLDFVEMRATLAGLAPESAFGPLSLIALLLFIGAIGKSAQIPLYVWLPDAMEGPTPVSALIHAATMVTAGVYMIGRNAALFSHAPDVLAIVAGIGAATALMAGTIGLVQNDIKRVLAYSTVSQLGLMFLAMGVGAYAAGIFHLYTHAFFKALLFLGSGAVIHALAGEQDVRRMGGLRRDLPVTYMTFTVGALAIAGFPLLSGFFSKDEILYRTFAGGHRLLWTLGAITSLLTATYMFRLVFLTFHGERQAAGGGAHVSGPGAGAAPGHGQGHGSGHAALHDAPLSMAIPLVVLALGSIFAGLIGVPHALGGENRIERFLEPSFSHQSTAVARRAGLQARLANLKVRPPAGDETDSRQQSTVDSRQSTVTSRQSEDDEAAQRLEINLMVVSTLVAFAGIGLALVFFLRRRDLADAAARRFAGVHRLLLNKYYVDDVYDAALVQPIKVWSERALWRGVDEGVIDGAVNGAGRVIEISSARLRRLQTGSVRAYAASLFLGAVLVLGYYLWR